MRFFVTTFFLIIFLISCKKENTIQLSFLDEYVLADSIYLKNTLVGGLSGIDYNNGEYFMVVDDDDSPRIITAEINVKKDSIFSVVFLDVIHLDKSIPFFKNNALDLESVFIDGSNHLNIVSEGSIKNGKNPSIFSVNKQGAFMGSYALQECFKANSYAKPRHNAVFEASCKGFDGKGFWVGMEGVLEADGEAPSQEKVNPPARITYYNSSNKNIIKQFAYPLDYIVRPSKGKFNVNGITAILEFKKNVFFVVERCFQSGYGVNGNIIRIYKVILDETISNTSNVKSLKEENYIPVKKELLFDFDVVRSELTGEVIDNVEGITLGPKLSNGNSSLILITDDNFQKHGKQLSQFIMLEIKQ